MDDQALLSFGLWIKRRRKALDLTQDGLAALVGCSKDLIVKIEGDARRPSREIAALLATQLQLAPEERDAFIRCARAELAPDRLPPPSKSVPRAAFVPAAPSPPAPPRGNLPAQLSSFLGRNREIADLQALLGRADVRLVTLTGTGGTGKTRLALAVASALTLTPSPAPVATGEGSEPSTPPRLPLRERGSGGEGDFPDGIFFVDLAPISDPALVATTIAQTLGVTDAGSQPIRERLKRALRTKDLLLLLDNFEQVLDAAPLVAELLAAAPGLKVLVTSRVVLHLSGEHEYAVPPLALPPTDDGRRTTDDQARGSVVDGRSSVVGQYAAVALFIARAQAAKADFAVTDANAPAVAEICVRLDGLPLAIELAAARIKLFPPEALLNRLRAPLALLIGGPRDRPARQQTIRNTIDWSYNLLSADEQRLFRRLGVFVGGFTLEAAEFINDERRTMNDETAEALDNLSSFIVHPSSFDRLASLLDQSLLVVLTPVAGEPRYGMLETLREYALERLAEAGEVTETRRRHAAYFVALAEAISAEGGEYEHSDERTRTEYANLREVLVWCRTAGPGGAPAADLGMRLAKTLRHYWLNDDLYEGLRWLRELCGSAWRHGPAHLRARLLSSLGQYMFTSPYPDDQSQAAAVLEEGVRLSREIGDMWALAEACRHRGEAALHKVDPAAEVWLVESLTAAEVWLVESMAAARAAGSPWNIAWTQVTFGISAIARGDDQAAARLFEECLPVFQRLGNAVGVSESVHIYSIVLLRLGAFDRAAKLLDETLDSFRPDLSLFALCDLHDLRGQVAYAQSDLRQASDLFVQALRFGREYAQQFLIAGVSELLQALLGELAVVAAALGNHVHATHLFCHARERIYFPQPTLVQAQIGASLAACRAALGDAAFDAAWAVGQALTLEQAVAEALGGSE